MARRSCTVPRCRTWFHRWRSVSTWKKVSSERSMRARSLSTWKSRSSGHGRLQRGVSARMADLLQRTMATTRQQRRRAVPRQQVEVLPVQRTLDGLCSAMKEYALVQHNRQVRFYVPTHSLLNYTQWRIVSPESALLDLPGVDGYIAQVWTGTVTHSQHLPGRTKERTFETAYLEYGVMQELSAARDADVVPARPDRGQSPARLDRLPSQLHPHTHSLAAARGCLALRGLPLAQPRFSTAVTRTSTDARRSGGLRHHPGRCLQSTARHEAAK